MSSDSLSHGINKTLQAFAFQIEQFALVSIEVIGDICGVFVEAASSWESPIEFTALQWTLLKLLVALLVCTVLLIGYSWKIYGKVITEKFVRPSMCRQMYIRLGNT